MTKKSTLAPSNGWYNHNGSDTVFVFVHGFLSSSSGCWTYKKPFRRDSEVFWPDILINDKRFDNPSIFLGGFYTSRKSKDYSIADCATELFDSLNRVDISGRQPPMTRKRIVFVCHSLGGIVTRYMLSEHQEHFMHKPVGLVLLASPSLGSGFADTAQKFLWGYGNEVLQQLKHQGPLLTELDRKFSSLVRTKKLPYLVGAEAYENQPVISIWPLSSILGKIVEKNSAWRYFEGRNLRCTNHSSIAKPDSNQHPSHEFLLDFYSREFNPAVLSSSPSQSHAFSENNTGSSDFQDSQNTQRNILFTRYEKKYEKYYFKRPIDTKVAALLNVSGLWISGDSGIGKTCTITRNLVNADSNHLYINLANCIGQPVKRMFGEIYLNIAMHFNQPTESVDVFDLTAIISKTEALLTNCLYGRTLYIFIEEIPLDSTPSFSDFIGAAISLLVKCSSSSSASPAKFLFSSIESPELYIPKNQHKIIETMKFLEFDRWGMPELELLLMHLSEFLGFKFYPDMIKEIVNRANGSPRFIKTFLLNMHVASTYREAVPIDILVETEVELS